MSPEPNNAEDHRPTVQSARRSDRSTDPCQVVNQVWPADPIRSTTSFRGRGPLLLRCLSNKYCKLVLLMIVLFFVGKVLLRHFRTLRLSAFEFEFKYVALGLGCLFLVGLIGVLNYRMLLSRFFAPPNWRKMLMIACVPQLGKYIPGKVASVAAAMWVLREIGLRKPVAASVILLHQGLVILTGFLVGLPILIYHPVAAELKGNWFLFLGCLALALVSLHPFTLKSLINRLLHKLNRAPLERFPGLRDYLILLLLMSLNRCFHGVALWFVARSLTELSITTIPIFIACFALATTVGFIAFFAPAGLGVREGMLLVTLSPMVAGSAGALVVVGMRLFQTLVELVLAGAGLLAVRSLMPDRSASSQ